MGNKWNPGCCDCCPIKWTFIDCRLYWKVTTPPVTDFGVTISGPGGYSESFTNQPNGMIELPTTGTWTASLLLPGYYSPSAECEITIVECTPVDPCCVKSIGTHGIFSNAPGETLIASTTTFTPGFTYGLYRMDISDYSDLNCSWYRDFEMEPPNLKTEHVCYDRIVAGRIAIGSIWTKYYKVGNYSLGYEIFHNSYKDPADLDESDAMLGEWGLVENHADVFLEFSYDVYYGFYVRIISKITSSSVTQSGTPWSSAPSPLVVDDEYVVVGDIFLLAGNQIEGLCGPYHGTKIRRVLDSTTIAGSITYDAWPEIGP
jgi:hypothetical protein